jgi:hypothetical protein
MIDSILTEWRYRLPHGYPKSADDFMVLKDVILEMTDIDLSEAEHIVRRAMGLNESPVDFDIKSMYTNRVIRIVKDSKVIVYSLQPYDDHDFDVADAAQNKISGTQLSVEELSNIIEVNSAYNFYIFNRSYKLVNSGETTGQLILNSVSTDTQDFIDADSFEKFILDQYAVGSQKIGGLKQLFDQLQNDTEVLDLIRSNTPDIEVNPGQTRITGKYERLYDAIDSAVKVTGGHSSELWFSIVFKGYVKGSVKNIPALGIENDLKSDVVTKDGQRFSLKAYGDITFDFGMLDKDALIYLRSFLALAELITGTKMKTVSLSIPDINENVLRLLNSEHVQNEIKELLQLDSPFATIKNLQAKIRSIMQDMDIDSPDYIESVTKKFCINIDNSIEQHITKNIDWWALIITGNKTLNLIPSHTIVDSLKHTEQDGEYYLSTNISSFHQGHLNVKTSHLGVSAAKYKD